jgi:uroporphyrinogen-III synthase
VTRTVLITGRRAEPLRSALAARGLAVVWVPLIATRPTGAPAPGGRPDVVLVSSSATARHATGLRDAVAGARVVAVGEATAASLRGAGVPVHTVASGSGADLARHAGSGVTWHIGGRRLSGTLAAALAALPEAVTRWIVYETGPSPGARRALDVAAVAVTLASGSAARAWVALGGGADRRFVAIGPDTAAAAGEAGLPVAAVAETPDAEGLADAVARALGGP